MPTSDDPLKNILKRTKVGPPPDAVQEHDVPVEELEPDALSIGQMDGHYSSMRPANKNLTRLHIIKKNGAIISFQFHFLDAKSTFDGSTFTLLFAGAKHWEVKVKGCGPKFWPIYDYCTLHRWVYLREATDNEAKFADKSETVLTEITITDVTPRSDE